jgi:DNA-binding transcriptional regulator YdaS (Cro superfamily)
MRLSLKHNSKASLNENVRALRKVSYSTTIINSTTTVVLSAVRLDLSWPEIVSRRWHVSQHAKHASNYTTSELLKMRKICGQRSRPTGSG